MFTVLFGELFGGAIAGEVKAYLPTIVPGLVIMNALTTSQSVGVDLREDMDKGVFDRFRTMPMSRIAPVLGPMVSDVLRYLICTSLTVLTGYVLGYRPENGWSGTIGAIALAAGCAWAIAWIFLFLGTVFSSAQAVTSFTVIVLFPLTFLSTPWCPPRRYRAGSRPSCATPGLAHRRTAAGTCWTEQRAQPGTCGPRSSARC